MNGEKLYELLQDLPDEFITEAAVPHRRRRISMLAVIPAIAACLAVVIAAAVYPKLRAQRPADIAAPIVTEQSAESGTDITQTAFTTAGTAPETASAAPAKTTITKAEALPETSLPGEPETAAVPQTTAPVPVSAVTTAAASQIPDTPVTEYHAESPDEQTMTEADPQHAREPQRIEIPVRSVQIPEPAEESTQESIAPPNHTSSRFFVMHQAEALSEFDRGFLGDVDFAKQDVLFCDLYSNCAAVRIGDAALKGDTFTLNVQCTDASGSHPVSGKRYAFSIPKSLGMDSVTCQTLFFHSGEYFSHNPLPAESETPEPESIILTVLEEEESG